METAPQDKLAMSHDKEPKRLIKVVKKFDTTCLIYFAAPYSISEEVSLPEGLILQVHPSSSHDDSTYFATPADSNAWAPFLVSATHRFDRNFRGNYGFDLGADEIEKYCDVIDQIPEQTLPRLSQRRALQGSLFGTAVGDAIGLPYEGLSAKRIEKFHITPLRHRFLFGRGMLSDDTEHSCIVAHALVLSGGDPEQFTKNLCWSLRFWLLGLPAGIGMATLRACVKLWLFLPAHKSGVFSAGNGPAMRSSIIGVYAYDDEALRSKLVEISTVITHTDPKALKGARIVAEMAARITSGSALTTGNCLQGLAEIIGEDDELRQLVKAAVDSANENQDAREFCKQQNQSKGVGGYIYHTLPVVIQIVLRYSDNYEAAITQAILCGGDTDTVAAIIGGIVGTNVGTEGIPQNWITELKDWPRNRTYLHLLADELAAVKWDKKPGVTQWMDPIRLWIRNAFFMFWVLAHGFRRLLPPY